MRFDLPPPLLRQLGMHKWAMKDFDVRNNEPDYIGRRYIVEEFDHWLFMLKYEDANTTIMETYIRSDYPRIDNLREWITEERVENNHTWYLVNQVALMFN